MGLNDKLLAAALAGAVLGAVGCGASNQAQPTTPEGASGEKHQCKGEHQCSGQHQCKGEHGCGGQPQGAADPAAAPSGETSATEGEKASCKGHGGCQH